jgi:hypothetical protein
MVPDHVPETENTESNKFGESGMEINLDRVRRNVEQAETEDLLDRATVYRREMEADALALVDAELVERGVSVEDVEAHLKTRQGVLTREDGTAVKCSFCRCPAIARGLSWHWLFRRIRLFPMQVAWCELHLPADERHKLDVERGDS